jgi:chemotaxis protein CheX
MKMECAQMLNGVRTSMQGYRGELGTTNGEKTMTLTLRDSMHLLSDPDHLDESVREVFETMFGVRCCRGTDLDTPGDDSAEVSVTAVVGFGGILSGACVFRCEAPAARLIATVMTGMEFDAVDDTVKDAIGEICNMLAGTWKSKIPELAANCGLSVPAVITGSDYNLYVQAPEFKICQAFRFDNARFEMTIVCDGLQ